FFFVAHHIICNATWILEFYRQIQNAYNKAKRGEKISLQPCSFAQAVNAERKYLNKMFKASASNFWLQFIADRPLKVQLPYHPGVDTTNLDNLRGNKKGAFVYFEVSLH